MANYTEILFEKLQQAGLSVYQFSKDTGIPKGRIYQWRRGNGNPKDYHDVLYYKGSVTWKILYAIAEALNGEMTFEK